MFLSAAELKELTDYEVPAYQAQWLEDHGYPFDMSRLGKPKVLKAYVDQRLGGIAVTAPKGQTEPDFTHWK